MRLGIYHLPWQSASRPTDLVILIFDLSLILGLYCIRWRQIVWYNPEVRFKALIFDLDGTAVEASRFALPSPRLIEAVRKAKLKTKVSVATGRTLSFCIDILKRLKLSGPVVISGGSQILNPVSEEVLWQKVIQQAKVQEILKLCHDLPYSMALSDDPQKFPASELKSVRPFETVVFIHSVDKNEVAAILKILSKIPELAAKTGNSFTKGKVDINITHRQATKEHGLKVLLEMLEVNPDDCLAVGDSNNDLALFNQVGFKVAMGNATKELKEVADFIAPPIEEDGLILVIEKFILELS